MVDADVGVVGAGTVGSLVAGILAERGLRVHCFEQFEIGHGRGGAGGGTRMFRVEHGPGAPPLEAMLTAEERWRRLESLTSRRILELRGGLWLGERDGAFIQNILAGAQRHGLPSRPLEPAEMARQFPQHRLAPGDAAVLDQHAGYLHAGAAVESAITHAIGSGATVMERTQVSGIEAASDGVRLTAGHRSWSVARVLIAAGSWVTRLLPALSHRLTVKRLVLAWASPTDLSPYHPGRFPMFIRSSAGVDLTGWPTTDGRSVKLSQFAPVAEGVDPEQEPTGQDSEVRERLGLAVARFVPGLAGKLRMLYLNDAFTALGRPIMGEVPGMPGVFVIAGLSGRGFKLAPVLAEAAADAVTADRRPQLHEADTMASGGAASAPPPACGPIGHGSATGGTTELREPGADRQPQHPSGAGPGWRYAW